MTERSIGNRQVDRVEKVNWRAKKVVLLTQQYVLLHQNVLINVLHPHLLVRLRLLALSPKPRLAQPHSQSHRSTRLKEFQPWPRHQAVLNNQVCLIAITVRYVGQRSTVWYSIS